MNAKQLLKSSPKFHKDGFGNLVSWQISDRLFKFLDDSISDNLATLETGAGLSTLLFAVKGCKHTCIVPNKSEVRRIQLFCKKNKILLNKVNFIIGNSEYMMQKLKTKKIDILLIDGNHAFPIPFIDWYYGEKLLKLDGMLIIDDIQLWTGKILKDYLIHEPEWGLVKILGNRTAIFKKMKNSQEKGWQDQLYIVKKSGLPQALHLFSKFKDIIKYYK